MTPLSPAEAFSKYPDLAARVVTALTRAGQPAPAPAAIAWFVQLCHDDADQPLDEAACATMMATGLLPCNLGLLGRIEGREACFCEKDLVAPGSLRSA